MVTFQKGQQLSQAGRYIEAAYELAAAMREVVSDYRVPRDVSYQIATALQQARSHIGVLYIMADDGREVTVDGTEVGKAPIYGEILVSPGKHRVIARGDICLGSTDLDVPAGESRRVKVPCVTSPRWRTPVLVTGLIGACLGLIVGGVTLAVSEEKRQQIDILVAQAHDAGFVGTDILDMVEARERERVDLLNTSITGFLAGGALLAGTSAVFFGVKRQRPAEPPPLVGATIGVGQVGLWMRW